MIFVFSPQKRFEFKEIVLSSSSFRRRRLSWTTLIADSYIALSLSMVLNLFLSPSLLHLFLPHFTHIFLSLRLSHSLLLSLSVSLPQTHPCTNVYVWIYPLASQCLHLPTYVSGRNYVSTFVYMCLFVLFPCLCLVHISMRMLVCTGRYIFKCVCLYLCAKTSF